MFYIDRKLPTSQDTFQKLFGVTESAIVNKWIIELKKAIQAI